MFAKGHRIYPPFGDVYSEDAADGTVADDLGVTDLELDALIEGLRRFAPFVVLFARRGV